MMHLTGIYLNDLRLSNGAKNGAKKFLLHAILTFTAT